MARRVEIFNNQWRIQGKGPGGGGETGLIAGHPSPIPLISRSGSGTDNNHTIEDCMRDLLEDALHLAARTLRFPGISQSS